MIMDSGLRLIDFDWSGKVDTARYPVDVSLVPSLRWHTWVCLGGLIAKNHWCTRPVITMGVPPISPSPCLCKKKEHWSTPYSAGFLSNACAMTHTVQLKADLRDIRLNEFFEPLIPLRLDLRCDQYRSSSRNYNRLAYSITAGFI